MANKVVVWVLAGAGLALASGAAWWVQQPGNGAAADKPAAAGPGAPGAARPGGASGPGGPGGPGGGGAPGVEVAKVKTMPLQDDAQAVGSLKSRQSVILRPEVAGRVAEVAFAAQAGHISEPIVTEDAVFILKIEELTTAGIRPLAEVRDEIDQALQAEESARRRKQWIDSIREKAFIRLF